MEEHKTSEDSKQTHIPWHSAFIEALQMELEEYGNALEFYSEYQLTAEPLRIDCVVVKKNKDTVIKKNIAAIFKEINLIEYKSPDDYVSVADFYKVYGYACLYASIEKKPITGLTVSFVESHYPDKLLSHLKDERGYTVAETCPGVYNISGDILPIQVIDSRQLSAEENLWLKCLSNRLDSSAVIQIGREAARKDKAARIHAYLDAVTRANILAIKEAISMSDEVLTLERVFEESGLAARWEARGETHKAFTIAKNLVDLGLPFETVVSATQLDPDKVKTMYVNAGKP